MKHPFIYRARVARQAYISRENEQWVAWTIRKGVRVYLAASSSMDEIEERLEQLGYQQGVLRSGSRVLVKDGKIVKREWAKRPAARIVVEPQKRGQQ